MRKALFWAPLGEATVKCLLCGHFCMIKEGKCGICGVRTNKGSRLYTLSYGNIIAQAPDPIEKKPLYHFLPGSYSYSIASPGCNFSCLFCQNHSISQIEPETAIHFKENSRPEDIVASALALKCRSISYTYTEPAVSFEFAYDTAQIASKEGLKNIFVTNGYISGDALDTILPYIDAANVDLKGDKEFYRKLCGAKMTPVVETIERMKSAGVWVEVTTLLIPGYNDSGHVLRELSGIIRGVDACMPWHITRFFPVYKMSGHYPADIPSIKRARQTALDSGVKYVYTGNIEDGEGSNTYCGSCGSLLIQRDGYSEEFISFDGKGCAGCGTKTEGVFK